MRTELRIDGSNCPTCLHATLSALRATPGVRSADASSTDHCLAIEHAEKVDVASLVDTVRANLHGVATESTEIVMVSIDPLVAELHCGHAKQADPA